MNSNPVMSSDLSQGKTKPPALNHRHQPVPARNRQALRHKYRSQFAQLMKTAPKLAIALAALLSHTAPAQGASFNFTYASGTTLEQMLGFEIAANVWSYFLVDDVEVNLFVEVVDSSLLPDKVIGGALPGLQSYNYGEFRQRLYDDRTSNDDFTAFDYLNVNTNALSGEDAYRVAFEQELPSFDGGSDSGLGDRMFLANTFGNTNTNISTSVSTSVSVSVSVSQTDSNGVTTEENHDYSYSYESNPSAPTTDTEPENLESDPTLSSSNLTLTHANAKALDLKETDDNAIDGYIVISNLSDYDVEWKYNSRWSFLNEIANALTLDIADDLTFDPNAVNIDLENVDIQIPEDFQIEPLTVDLEIPEDFTFDPNAVAVDIPDDSADDSALEPKSISVAIPDDSTVPDSTPTPTPDPVSTLDYVSVAIHEIGHALGFISSTDSVRANAFEATEEQNLDRLLRTTSLDMFRYGSATEDWLDLATGSSSYFSLDGGQTRIANFSGGGQSDHQGSHWKHGYGYGVMDPLLAIGQRRDVTDIDLQAFDSIGWDLRSDLRDGIDPEEVGNASGLFGFKSTSLLNPDRGPNWGELTAQAKQRLANSLGITIEDLFDTTTSVEALTSWVDEDSDGVDDRVEQMLENSNVYNWCTSGCGSSSGGSGGSGGGGWQTGLWQEFRWQTLPTEIARTNTQSVPEPTSTMGLFALGTFGIASRLKRRNRSNR